MRNGVSLRRTLAPRPPHAHAAVTVILNTNGRQYGDAQTVAQVARDSPGHLVDPVNVVEKATEKAGSGVHQRHTWTNRVKKRTLTSLSPKFQTFETIYACSCEKTGQGGTQGRSRKAPVRTQPRLPALCAHRSVCATLAVGQDNRPISPGAPPHQLPAIISS